MYYKKSYKGRYSKRYRKKSRYAPSGAWGTAMKALTIAQGLQKLINVEKKYITTNSIGLTASTSPAIYYLTLCPEGTGQTDRTGISIKAVSNSYKAHMQLNAVTPTDAIVRTILFRDDASNGVLPLATELLDGGSGGTPTIISHYNKDYIGSRFRVLHDKLITMNVNNISNHTLNLWDKLNSHIKYSGSTGNQSEATTGHYYVLIMSDNVASTAPSYVFENRLDFVDN